MIPERIIFVSRGITVQELCLGAVYGIALSQTHVIPPLYGMLLAAIKLLVIILCRQAALLPVTRTFNLPLKRRTSRCERASVRLACRLCDVSELNRHFAITST